MDALRGLGVVVVVHADNGGHAGLQIAQQECELLLKLLVHVGSMYTCPPDSRLEADTSQGRLQFLGLTFARLSESQLSAIRNQ